MSSFSSVLSIPCRTNSASNSCSVPVNPVSISANIVKSPLNEFKLVRKERIFVSVVVNLLSASVNSLFKLLMEV